LIVRLDNIATHSILVILVTQVDISPNIALVLPNAILVEQGGSIRSLEWRTVNTAPLENTVHNKEEHPYLLALTVPTVNMVKLLEQIPYLIVLTVRLVDIAKPLVLCFRAILVSQGSSIRNSE